jgi:hypothetical protein
MDRKSRAQFTWPRLPDVVAAQPRRWFVVILGLGLATFLGVAYTRALRLPFLGDDYLILDKVFRTPFLQLWEPKELLFNWYRPWSREFHYWVISRLVDRNEPVYHLLSFALWLVAMLLYFALLKRLAGIVVGAMGTLGLSVLALWSAPLLWIAGAQDLWMLVFALLFLHCVLRGQTYLALAPLVLALLSKETAAGLPLIALAYFLIVERCPPSLALRRSRPHLAILLIWIVLHPTLLSRLSGPLRHSLETEHRPSLLATLAKTLLAQINLDGRLAPELGWHSIAWSIGLISLLVAGIFYLALRAESGSLALPPFLKTNRLILFGFVWASIGWAILFLPSIGWHAYYGSLGSLGCWLAIALFLDRHRQRALPLLLLLAALGQARNATPSWDWGTFWYQRRAGSFLGAIRSRLQAYYPTLPSHSRLYFANIPNNVGFLAGDGPAIRIWYRDPTLRARYYSDYFPRAASDSLGRDFFFRFDPVDGLREVIAGPEPSRIGRQQSPAWEHNQRVLASLFLRTGNLPLAAATYSKLWRTFPQRPEYALYAATAYEAARDTAQSGIYYQQAIAALGATAVRNLRPSLVAAALDSARSAVPPVIE